MSDTPPLSSTVTDRLAGADARIFRFLEAWHAARRGVLIPDRRDFDPVDVPALMPNLSLYHLAPDREDFVCRLAGEAVNQAWGRSIRGLRLREIVGEADHSTIIARWRRIIDGPNLHYGKFEERLTALKYSTAERLLLPLGSAPGRIDMVLALSLYQVRASDPSRPALMPHDIIQIPCAEI